MTTTISLAGNKYTSYIFIRRIHTGEAIMSRTLTLAVLQPEAVSHSLTDSLDWLAKQAEQAAACGAQLALLPELFASPFWFTAEVWRWAQPQGGLVERFLQDTARANGLYLGGSYLEARGEHFYNTFALASPAGQIVGRVGKAHPCSLERAVFAPSPGAQVIDTELGRIGVAICYDNALREVVDPLLAAEPDVWLMPLSAPMPPASLGGQRGLDAYLTILRDSPAAMAALFGLPVAMANKCGRWQSPMPGWLPAADSHFPGLSCIADSDGAQVAALGAQPGFAVAQVTLDPARKRCQVPAAYQRHRPWLVAPPLDYRLFALFEWWGARHYRRHPQRAALAQQQSLCT
jgi:N-carbamoylputrescine amidase